MDTVNKSALMNLSARELAAEFNLRAKGKAGEMFGTMDDIRREVQRRAAISTMLNTIRRAIDKRQDKQAGQYWKDDPDEED